ncbi:hypothetical protein [Rathayibacter sp. AY1B8]|uniref:hypothetical protein n=1 Tax=Rathayibacter sp. AY1B8 TaxID=2080533 RepID=UPI000CE8C4FF|nr:hypothetical protein [Rathayibacter sp. AY1B8]PPI08239.1 hypothetical protein C5C63_04600 [Rathayibacter sp. AY1B8]
MADDAVMTRDSDSHALQMGAFEPPRMPGAFNQMVRDVSKRAGTVAGSIAQRDAFPLEKRFPGLCWVAIPDNPTGNDMPVELHYWSGTFWEIPDRKQRVLWTPRSAFDVRDDVGIKQGERFDVLKATWRDAPPGTYLIDGQYLTAAARYTEMIVASSYNGGSFKGDYRDDINTDRKLQYFNHQVEDHRGGDLEIKVWVTMFGTSAAIYKEGSGLRISYLGRYNN